jgi:DNA-directed RNA polymerase beta subunit
MNVSQKGFQCIAATPEGPRIGLTKFEALYVRISNPVDVPLMKDFLFHQIGYIPFTTWNSFMVTPDSAPAAILFLNGDPLGKVPNPHAWVQQLRRLRVANWVDKDVSVSYHFETKEHDIVRNEIHVSCDGGRYLRPLVRAKAWYDYLDHAIQGWNANDPLWVSFPYADIKTRYKRDGKCCPTKFWCLSQFSFHVLWQRGIIEYVDANEVTNLSIHEQKRFTTSLTEMAQYELDAALSSSVSQKAGPQSRSNTV